MTDLTGGGPFRLAPGQWTDDTSMALCLATSLLECRGFDPRDQMERYCRWRETGYLSSTGRCFDIGNTVAGALHRYRETGQPFAGSTSPRSAGNGSIMRLAPVPMYCFPDLAAAERLSADSSRTTHGAAECVDACRLLGRIIGRALLGRSKDEVLLADAAPLPPRGGGGQGESQIAMPRNETMPLPCRPAATVIARRGSACRGSVIAFGLPGFAAMVPVWRNR